MSSGCRSEGHSTRKAFWAVVHSRVEDTRDHTWFPENSPRRRAPIGFTKACKRSFHTSS